MKITVSTILLAIITPFALVVTVLTAMDGVAAVRNWWRARHAFDPQIPVDDLLRIEARLRQLQRRHGTMGLKEATRELERYRKSGLNDVVYQGVIADLAEYVKLLTELRSYKKVSV